MADNTIVLKRSAVAGKVPTTGSLSLGEIAINTFDGKLFFKKNNGTESIVELGRFAINNGDVSATDNGGGNYTVTINNDAVTFEKLQNIPTTTILGRASAGVGDVEALTPAQVRSFLNVSETTGNEGTVKSVGLALPDIFNVTGSPVTSTGTLTATLNTQNANLVFAGPVTGTAVPGFRALVSADIPGLDWSKVVSGKPTTLAGYGITDAVAANGSITAGTAAKITYDSKGLVTAGNPLSVDDIPDLDWGKITGKPSSLAGYNITDAVAANPTITGGTFTRITFDAKGLVTGGSNLTAADIPNITWTKIISTPTTLGGYGITDAVSANPAIAEGIFTKVMVDAKGLVTLGDTLDPEDIPDLGWDRIIDKPTTLAGYGITDAATATHNHDAAYVGLTGDQTITGNKTFSNTVTVNGDLVVNGATTTIDATNLAIADAVIQLARGNTGAAPFIGLQAERGTNDAWVLFNESTDRWGVYTGADTTTLALAGFEAATFYGAFSGNATTATRLATGRTISLTGNITGTSTAFDGSGNLSFATTIADDAVSNAMLANMAVNTIKGRATTGTGDPEDLTAAQVRTILNIADGANNYVHPTGDGNLHVPATGTTNNTRVLKAGATAGAIAWDVVNWTEINNKPTTLAGYGITDAATAAHNHDTQYLGISAKAADSGLLNGFNSATAATANTIALRDTGGNLTSGYYGMTHASTARTTDTIFYSSTDNFIRKTDATSFRTSLSVYSKAESDALSITGNAATATALQTSRNINGVAFNGTADITVTANTANTLTRGNYLTGSNFNGSAATTWAVNAATANTASTVVARDASGNFSAGTITAALVGNASTATALATARNINGVAFNGTADITVADNTKLPLTGGTLTGGLTVQGDLNLDANRKIYVGGVEFKGGGGAPWTVKTSAYTAVTGDRILANTSTSSFTITLPATPALGDEIIIADDADFSANNLIIARNGRTINGTADNLELDVAGIKIHLVYDGTTWETYFDSVSSGANGSLATVATTGSYTDLLNKPTIPTLPPLAVVATSGNYFDLIDRPNIPANFATVATSGSYNDLLNKPTAASLGVVADTNGVATNLELRASRVRAETAFSGSGTVTLNYANGDYRKVTATGAITVVLSNMPGTGQVGSYMVEATNWGAYSITHPTGTKFAGGVAPTFTASGIDIVTYVVDPTNVIRCFIAAKDVR